MPRIGGGDDVVSIGGDLLQRQTTVLLTPAVRMIVAVPSSSRREPR
jgi:hypothetical protein